MQRTFVYRDKAYCDDLPDQPFLPAALLVTRVISRPTGSTVCLDLGHKSVAAEKDVCHRVHFVNGPGAGLVSQSEEHFLLDVGDSKTFDTGDVLCGLPYHVCPTCALYDRAITVSGHEGQGEWTMEARKRSVGV